MSRGRVLSWAAALVVPAGCVGVVEVISPPVPGAAGGVVFLVGVVVVASYCDLWPGVASALVAAGAPASGLGLVGTRTSVG